VTAKAGLAAPDPEYGTLWAVAAAFFDYDKDGWLDLFVSNDNWPAFLFHNRQGRRFEEVALAAGVAYTEMGKEISGMGADARDLDNDGRPDVFQTALDGETMPLFRNRGAMTFEDWTGRAGLVAPTLANTGWSNGIVDFNNDGWKSSPAARPSAASTPSATSTTTAGSTPW